MLDAEAFDPGKLGIEYIEEEYETKAGNVKTRMRAVRIKKPKNKVKKENKKVQLKEGAAV